MTDESIHAAYRKIDTAYSSLDYKALLSLLSRDHETIHPDERRLTRQHLEQAAFPFDGIRYRQTVHTPLRIRFGPRGCNVLAESTSEMIVKAKSCQEDLLLQDLWKLEEDDWLLSRRIIMRQRRKAPGYFSLVEHPLYCQFGHCQTDKTTWKEPRRFRKNSTM
jgi:hypothetical protein